ncbi:glycosyltransferase [Marinobacter sp. GH_1]|uniref:glycosyltransferase n=1 Tax=Marinobacter sp. GH_1 TaxID=3402164 RepID=UPI003B43928C
MKVLHLIDSGGLYGAERMLLTLAAEQLAQGLSPMILSAGEPQIGDKPIETEARRLKIPVTPWRMKPGFNLQGSAEIIWWARAEGFQLLHSHGYKFNVLMGLWPERTRKLPLVATLHGYVKGPRYTKSWLYESIDRMVLTRMRQVVLVSEAMRQQVPKRIAHSDRTSVVANGLSTQSVREMANRPIPEAIETFIAGCDGFILGVGRLSAEKGFDRLIAAFAVLRTQHPRLGLVIVGEGKQRAALEEQAKALGISEGVLLPGYVQPVPPLMKRALVLCMPSLTEGLPITLLEAMTLEVPVVACDVGEIANVLGQGKGGCVFRYRDPEALAAELESVVSGGAEVSERLRWASQRAESDFSGRSMAERYRQIYERAVK